MHREDLQYPWPFCYTERSMTTLQEHIQEDMKEAMKQKEEARLSTLRMLKAALKNKQIDLMHELSEDDVLKVIKSQAKQLADAVVLYAEGGRQEAVMAAQKEIVLLESYLPAQMDDDMLEAKVRQALQEAGMQSKEQMGKAMGVAMKAVAGEADGSRVRSIVEKILAVFVMIIIGVGISRVVHAASSTFSSDFVITCLRIARAFLLVFGVASINYLLVGGFKYMIASGRNDEVSFSLHKITIGLIGTVTVACLYIVATSMLQALTTS